MYIFRRMALLLALLVAFSAMPALAEGADEELSCGRAMEMLLAAADDYNPDASAESLLAGFPGGAPEQSAPLTRAQALILLDRAFGGLPAPVGDAARVLDTEAAFSDIPAWAADALSPVLASGILSMTADGLFKPDEAITAAELERLICRAYALLGGNLKDDFYASVNRDWLAASTLSAGLSINGPFYGLTLTVNEQVAELIQQIAAGDPEPGTPEAKIKALYDCVTDREGRAGGGHFADPPLSGRHRRRSDAGRAGRSGRADAARNGRGGAAGLWRDCRSYRFHAAHRVLFRDVAHAG